MDIRDLMEYQSDGRHLLAGKLIHQKKGTVSLIFYLSAYNG